MECPPALRLGLLGVGAGGETGPRVHLILGGQGWLGGREQEPRGDAENVGGAGETTVNGHLLSPEQEGRCGWGVLPLGFGELTSQS